MAVAGSYAYVADGSSGLRIINVANPAAPTRSASYDTPGYAHGVAVAGSYAYVADGQRAARHQRGNPAAPTEVGFYDTPGAYGVAWRALCLRRRLHSGLRVINVANPATPTEAGFYDTPGYAQGVAVMGKSVYVADGGSGVRVIDVTNPASPIEVGFYDTAGGAADVTLVGRYVHVADSDGGLEILRIGSEEDRYVYLPLIVR